MSRNFNLQIKINKLFWKLQVSHINIFQKLLMLVLMKDDT